MQTVPPSTDPDRALLIRTLEKEERREQKTALLDFTIVNLLFWAAVLCSIGAVLAGVFGASKILISALAGTPALIMVIEQTFSFQVRSSWHWKKMYDLKHLKELLSFDRQLSVVDAVEQKQQFEREMEPLFPQLKAPFLQDHYRVDIGQTGARRTRTRVKPRNDDDQHIGTTQESA